MRKASTFAIALILTTLTLRGQQVEFFKDVAPIIHQNCTPCHRPGGVGPFSLMTYQDVAKRGEFIGTVTKKRYMPPWFAEKDFGEFRNERGLSDDEIETIDKWIKGGLAKGREKEYTPLATNLTAESVSPDLTLALNKPFTIPGNNSEQFIFFNVPTNLPEDAFISSIEFNPDNKKLVHHSRIMTDTSNLMRTIDGMSELNPDIKEFQRIPLADQFLYGWVPGNLKIFFPPGTGKKLYKNTDLIVNIHYAPSPVVATDQSRINIYLAKEKVTREVKTITITEDFITNQPFVIPAETVKTFYSRTEPIGKDLSIIAVLPHMHFLGKSFRAYALTSDGDVVKLVKIDNWNFNWQTTYQYKKLVKVPKGSVIYVEATYDNTSNNLSNPNDPVRDVTYGWNTTDEMMNFIIYCMEHKEGDENWEY